jgi:hypothetical protein
VPVVRALRRGVPPLERRPALRPVAPAASPRVAVTEAAPAVLVAPAARAAAASLGLVIAHGFKGLRRQSVEALSLSGTACHSPPP